MLNKPFSSLFSLFPNELNSMIDPPSALYRKFFGPFPWLTSMKSSEVCPSSPGQGQRVGGRSAEVSRWERMEPKMIDDFGLEIAVVTHFCKKKASKLLQVMIFGFRTHSCRVHFQLFCWDLIRFLSFPRVCFLYSHTITSSYLLKHISSSRTVDAD